MISDLQNNVLERIATGQPVAATLDVLCRGVEAILPGVTCTVLAVDPLGCLRPLAGPSLPPHCHAAIDGAPIGPKAGSCGTAAWTRRAVEVTDIATDPLWDDYKQLVLPLGLRACWSSPIFSDFGATVGCFAFYFREPRGPTAAEREVVAACVHLCMIALDRDRTIAANQELLFRDGLTGLGNRAAFEQAIAAPRGGGWALMLLDVDELKTVNDMFGHRAGDWMISTVAQRVAEVVGRARAYRIGGDELAVLIEHADPTAEVARLAAALLATIEHPADCGGQMLTPAISIGAAVVAADAELTTDGVRQQADLALYHAKETEKGSFVLYAADLGTRIDRRLAAVRRVRAAVASEAIECHYQPIVRLDSRAPIALEALCRVRIGYDRYVDSATLQDALTDAHVATDITRVMLARICADIRTMDRLGLPLRPVALNLTPFDFRQPGIADTILAAIDRAGIAKAAVSVEITESVSLGRHNEVVTAELTRLRAHGISAALDDFGTGYASLTHLLSTPIDYIKVDSSFVGDGRRGLAIIDGVARIAGALGISLVVEGVERETQVAALARIGCKVMQGFHFAHPMPLAGTIDYLTTFAPSGQIGAASLHRRCG